MDSGNKCHVCGAERHPLAEYCRRCKRILDRVDMRRRPDRAARVRAMQQAWDGTSFRCYYSGVPLDEVDHHSPRYLTFDHRTPGCEEDMVLATACLNDMKSDMTEDEFRRMVLELASRFQGGVFDESALNLTHWTR